LFPVEVEDEIAVLHVHSRRLARVPPVEKLRHRVDLCLMNLGLEGFRVVPRLKSSGGDNNGVSQLAPLSRSDFFNRLWTAHLQRFCVYGLKAGVGLR